MTWTHQPLQLAGSYLQKRFAGSEIFDDKASFEPPCPNIANLPFGFHQFIQLPAFDLAGRPDLVLTPRKTLGSAQGSIDDIVPNETMECRV